MGQGGGAASKGPLKRAAALKKVPFGNSGMMVTEVCGGTMTWGSFNGEEEEAYAQLDKLVELGVNFIDTAELYPVAFNYGKTTEVWIGNWLEKRVAEGKIKREDLVIATKCNPSAVGCPLESRKDKPHSYDEEVLTASCKASLERMKCGYIDLYQLHWPSRDTPIFGCASFMPDGVNRPPKFNDRGTPEDFEKQVLNVKKLLDAGLIKHWGLSNENAYGITMFCMTADRLGVPRPVSCQNDFSLANRTYECDTWEAAYRFGVVGLPYGCLAGGVLSGKYLKADDYRKKDTDRPIDQCRMRKCPEFQPRYGNPLVMEATEKYVKIAEEWGITPTELALAWARDRKCNASIIMGSTTVRQVEECVGAFLLEPLPEELLSEIDHVYEEFRNPASHYVHKPFVMEAKWLGKRARTAMQA